MLSSEYYTHRLLEQINKALIASKPEVSHGKKKNVMESADSENFTIAMQGRGPSTLQLRLLNFLTFWGGGGGRGSHPYMAKEHNTFPPLESSQLSSGQGNYQKPIIRKI